MFGPVTGASSLRETPNRYLFHVRAGYGDEAQRIVQQLRQMPSATIRIGSICALRFLISYSTSRWYRSAISPVIKIAANPHMYARLTDDMDINAGAVLDQLALVGNTGAGGENLPGRLLVRDDERAAQVGLLRSHARS